MFIVFGAVIVGIAVTPISSDKSLGIYETGRFNWDRRDLLSTQVAHF